MFHCNVNINTIRLSKEIEDFVSNYEAPERFEFEVSKTFDLNVFLLLKSDVAIIDVGLMDVKESMTLLQRNKPEHTKLIVCASKVQIPVIISDEFKGLVDDIWPSGLSLEEFEFYFEKVIDEIVKEKDAWLNKLYLDNVINATEDMVWFKDKNGAHLKVNDVFCGVVNKTHEQIQGRGHYYIWDIEPDDYAKGEYICNESEFEVMDKKEKCFFDEKVKVGTEMRMLKTCKAPLFDFDGTVMGTVGVAHDVTQEKHYEEIIERGDTIDEVTGLYNRRWIYEILENCEGVPVALYYMDLKGFKGFNARAGYLEGDKALKITAEAIQAVVPTAMIARVGDDEFMVAQTGNEFVETMEQTKEQLKNQIDGTLQMEDMVGLSIQINAVGGTIVANKLDQLLSLVEEL